MTIQQNVKYANRFAFENADSKTLAVIVNMNQLYIEYLDELETALLSVHPEIDTITLNGKTTIKFHTQQELETWITSNK